MLPPLELPAVSVGVLPLLPPLPPLLGLGLGGGAPPLLQPSNAITRAELLTRNRMPLHAAAREIDFFGSTRRAAEPVPMRADPASPALLRVLQLKCAFEPRSHPVGRELVVCRRVVQRPDQVGATGLQQPRDLAFVAALRGGGQAIEATQKSQRLSTIWTLVQESGGED